MKTKQLLFHVALIALFCQCSPSRQIGFKDGSCYAKCLVPHQANQDYDEYAVYTGNASEENVEVEVKNIVIQEKSKGWVKKKADRNCMSANPDDCLVWCLVETPEKIETLTILVDTTQSKNYELKKIYKNSSPSGKGTTEWREVLCENDLTKSIISDIQTALKYKLLYNGEINGKLDSITKEALRNFQKRNNLPQGQLDLETLAMLGISTS